MLSVDKIVPKRWMQWTEEAMEAAMSDVRSGKYSVLCAAKLYGIPKSTLHDRISGKVIHGQKPGPKRYFTPAEENDMADLLVDVAKADYGKKITQAQNIAGMAAYDKGRVKTPTMLSYGWFRRFLEWHPHLSYHKGISVEIKKDRSSPDINNKDIENWGDLQYISKYLEQFVLDGKPQSKQQMVRISDARVLTGGTCAAILQEREEKKQKEKAEKGRENLCGSKRKRKRRKS